MYTDKMSNFGKMASRMLKMGISAKISKRKNFANRKLPCKEVKIITFK